MSSLQEQPMVEITGSQRRSIQSNQLIYEENFFSVFLLRRELDS